ncbi:hypothetical protein L7F22_023880 [Adiantum nelumboides]|nr:hypothetical protein [Adiantum nelumboides]
MSGLNEDLGSSLGDAVARLLYDPAFKLFGRTIPVSSECKGVSSGGQDQPDHPMVLASGEASSVQDVDDETPESEDESSTPNELGSSSGSNDGEDEEKMVDMINDDLGGAPLHEEGSNGLLANEEAKGDESMDQAPKKPDKPIPCPRCQSLDTKFCYFNNYNVNQPRHFCKNCQRYWTAVGTLWNVPVGARRHKNKHSSPQARPVLMDVVVVRSDPPENAQQLVACSSSMSMGLNRQIKGWVQSTHMLPLDLPSIASFDSSPSSGVLWICHLLQGYKPEMSQASSKRNLAALNVGGVQTEQSLQEEKAGIAANAAGVSPSAEARLRRPYAKQSTVERPSKPEAPFTCAS